MTLRFKICIFIISLLSISELYAQKQREVLLISSYNSRFPTFFQQINGVKSVLDTLNVNLDLEFMDSKRFVDPTTKLLFMKMLVHKLSNCKKYDAIITTDDNALNFIIEYQDSLFKDIPIVFCGVNSIDNAIEQNSNPYITGVVEAVSMKETIELMFELFPEKKEIYAIVDSTSSGQGDLDTYYKIGKQMPEFEFKEIALHSMTFEEYKIILQEIPPDVPVLLLSAYHDKTKNTIDFKESISIINNNLNAPLFHLWQHGMGDGVLGGKIISHYEQGKTSALLVSRVLSGENISTLNVINESPNIFMFDYNKLVKHNVDIQKLIYSAVIINKPVTFYSKYKNIIHVTILIFILLVVFIIILSINILKRRKVEIELTKQNVNYAKLNREYSVQNKELLKAKQLAEINELRFRHLFENNPVSLWEEDFSEVRKLISKTKEKINNIDKYINENDDFVVKCASLLKIVNINQATLTLFRYNTKEKIISNLSSTFNATSFKTFKNLLLSIAEGKRKFITETEYVKKDGTIITAIVHIFSSDESKNSIIAVVDTTLLKQAEKELMKQYTELQVSEEEIRAANEKLLSTTDALKESNIELLIAKEKAEESDQLKTEFIHNMSHEIRTPMNGILGFSEFLNNSNLSEAKRKHYVNIIQNSGNQLMRIIDDILEISRLGTKQVKVSEKEICLNDLLLEQFSIFDIKAKENKTPLYLKKGLSDIESTVIIDDTKLNKIVSNLLENALKFTNTGFIEFGYLQKNTELEIYIKDTGIGINLEKQEIIFERFSQEEKGLSRNVGGLGLGLSISKENAELLGGKITLKSEKGKGATFFVTIPYKPVQPENEKDNSNNENVTEKQDKYTILIVEDEEVNYLFIETLLEDEIEINCNILHAKHGKEAVEMCNENTEIDFILMDMKMPIMNGFEATKLIKEFRPDLQIVAQTAYTTIEDKEKAFSAGCDDFISKPINKETLNEIMNKYLITK